MSDTAATVLIGLVMVGGLAGTVIPLLPGLLLIWAAALLYGLLVGFGGAGLTVMIVLTAIVGVSAIKSIVVPQRMADGHGVSRWSQLAALAGAIVGLVLIPVVGIVVGALVGLVLAEYANHRNGPDTWRATVAVAKGFGLSALIDVGLGMVMIGVWSIWALAVLT